MKTRNFIHHYYITFLQEHPIILMKKKWSKIPASEISRLEKTLQNHLWQMKVKKQKEAKTFREGLKKGDKVVSIGGIHGKVVDMNERTVLIQVDGAKIRIEKTALNPAGEASEEDIKANA